MSRKYYLDWKEDVYTWSEKEWNWIDVYILIEETVGEILGGNYNFEVDPLDPWDTMEKRLKEKKIEQQKISQLLEVIVSVKGEDKKFTKSRNTETKITIEDIQKTLNKYGNGHIQVKAEIKK